MTHVSPSRRALTPAAAPPVVKGGGEPDHRKRGGPASRAPKLTSAQRTEPSGQLASTRPAAGRASPDGDSTQIGSPSRSTPWRNGTPVATGNPVGGGPPYATWISH